MVFYISKFIFFFLRVFDLILVYLTNKSFMLWLKEFIEEKSYKKKKILGKEALFFAPNYISSWLVDNFYSLEPETINWVNKFKKKKIIFWDIGASIGLVSIYAGIKFKNIKIFCFEPSTSNLRLLSRNIFINNLNKKIIINPFPLTKLKNQFQNFNESKFIEGIGEHSYGVSENQYGSNFNPSNSYKTYGTSINYLLEKKILEIPDYIKIDVDGIESLILAGGSKYLKNKKIKSLLIEMNENNKRKFRKCLKILKKNNFSLKERKRSNFADSIINKKMRGVYNFIFEKNL